MKQLLGLALTGLTFTASVSTATTMKTPTVEEIATKFAQDQFGAESAQCASENKNGAEYRDCWTTITNADGSTMTITFAADSKEGWLLTGQAPISLPAPQKGGTPKSDQ